jgi:glucokinase
MQAIAIEAGISQIRGGLVTEKERRIKYLTIDAQGLGLEPDVTDTLRRIRAVGDIVRRKASMDWADVAGVGVTIPNSVNKFGVVGEGTMLKGWDNQPVRELLQMTFPEVPARCVIVLNDTHSSALGEVAYGEGRGNPKIDLVHFTVTAGIGAGIVLNGRLHMGASGYAGELGHIVIDPSGPLCPGCKRQRGCLETISSGTAVAQKAAELIEQGKGKALLEAVVRRVASEEGSNEHIIYDGGGSYKFYTETVDGGRTYTIQARDVVKVAQMGDLEAQEIIEEAGRGLGQAIIQVLHIVNPSMIVVGGVMSHISSVYLRSAEDWVFKHALRPARAVAAILPSSLHDLGTLYGAAAALFALEEEDDITY